MTVTPGSSGDFRRFWAALGASALGDGVRLAALPLLMYTLTTDPLSIALVTAASYVPWAAGPLVGALVDRRDRRTLLLAAQLVRALAIGGLAAAAIAGAVTPPLVYLVALVLGAGEVVVDTAIQAAIPQLSGDRTLESANSTLQATDTLVNRVVGPPVGALLFAAAVAAPFVVDGLTFVVAAALLAAIRTPLQQPRSRVTSFGDDVRAGLQQLRDDVVLRPLLLLLFLTNVAVMSYTSVFVLMALDVLGVGEAGYGLLLSAAALGGVGGGLAAPWLTARLGRDRLPTLLAAVAAFGLAVIWARPTLPIVVVGIVTTNAAGAAFNVVVAALRQALTPAELLGRVSSSFRAFTVTGVPVGAVLGGVVADLAGVPATFGAASVAFVVVTVGLVRVGRSIPERHRRPGPVTGADTVPG